MPLKSFAVHMERVRYNRIIWVTEPTFQSLCNNSVLNSRNKVSQSFNSLGFSAAISKLNLWHDTFLQENLPTIHAYVVNKIKAKLVVTNYDYSKGIT